LTRTSVTAPKCDSEIAHHLSSHSSSSGKLQLMLCSIGIRRSHLLTTVPSLSPQHPLLRSITEFSFKSPLIPREHSKTVRRSCSDSASRVARIAQSHFQRYPSPEDPTNRPPSTREPHPILPQLAPMNIRLHDQQISRIPKGSLLSQLVDCNDWEWSSPAWT
jgi:hypothetical protein